MKYEISPAPRKPRVSQETTKRRRNRKPMIDASPWLHLLGVLPDGEVADMAGCNETTARNWRVRRGIPSAMDSRRMQREAAETPEMTARRERRRERSKGWSGTQLAVTKWAKAWDDEHDAPFLTTTYADAVGVSVATAVARIERAVKRGEITEIDRHDPKRGVCGCYVVAA